ncbi:hypothetical protein SBD_7605 [Streptomyces bottropensis ATCC 25435]|uniref:Uncharacterized protein n=1 Tax=Streptomyces bottropensis ATCC 25435 TaxID=1054862 RepID=M3EPC3_9ACTN|nr:hypothetical protein SBD_7605 [Streptomyces bottropensis ATCC 25435]
MDGAHGYAVTPSVTLRPLAVDTSNWPVTAAVIRAWRCSLNSEPLRFTRSTTWSISWRRAEMRSTRSSCSWRDTSGTRSSRITPRGSPG